MQKAYAITAKAGRIVAGHTNNGAGSILFLTEKQAEYEVNLGTLVLMQEHADEARETETDQVEKPKKGRKAKDQDADA